MSPRCPTSPITPPIKDVAPPDSPVHPGPLPKPQISKPVDPIELIKEPKKYMLPKVPGKTFTAIPTFVGHYGEIYAQDIKPGIMNIEMQLLIIAFWIGVGGWYSRKYLHLNDGGITMVNAPSMMHYNTSM